MLEQTKIFRSIPYGPNLARVAHMPKIENQLLLSFLRKAVPLVTPFTQSLSDPRLWTLKFSLSQYGKPRSGLQGVAHALWQSSLRARIYVTRATYGFLSCVRPTYIKLSSSGMWCLTLCSGAGSPSRWNGKYYCRNQINGTDAHLSVLMLRPGHRPRRSYMLELTRLLYS